MTLRDVAARAGVSPRTVSNVVNDFRYVSPAMRTKVQAALDELGYKPNLLARGLRQGRTGIRGRRARQRTGLHRHDRRDQRATAA